MENINRDSCNKLITDSSSWEDLQMMAMEEPQQHNLINIHFHDHHQIIPTKNEHQQNPLLIPINHLQTVLDPAAAAVAAATEEEEGVGEEEEEELGAMKEMMYKMAAMQPVADIDPAAIRRPRRRNVRISDDPQSVAARRRRERISERIRVLQRLVPGGTKMDTASMLDEAIRYVKFLKRQIRLLNKPPNAHISHNNINPLSLASSSSSNYSSSDHTTISWGSYAPPPVVIPPNSYKILLPGHHHVHGHGGGSSAATAVGGCFTVGRGGAD